MNPRNVLITSLSFIFSMSLLAADAPRSIGFRGDGTGHFPADAKPPTEFDGVTGKNLVWKTPLPNFSNGSPIVVGKKVFVVCEAGWPAGQDCPTLRCYDADTGKELWAREIDQADDMPAEQATALKELRRRYWENHRRAGEGLDKYLHAADADKPGIITEYEKAIGNPGRLAKMYQGDWKRWTAIDQLTKENTQLIRKFGWVSTGWNMCAMGRTMPTPVSDGQRVYVVTGHRTVSAFDLTGQRVWHHFLADTLATPLFSHAEEDLGNAPLLVDGRLVMHFLDHLFCFDPATGKELWRTPSQGFVRHGMGTPVVLRLPEPAIFTWAGDLIRLRDGRKLLANVIQAGCANMVSDGAATVYTGSDAGHTAGGPYRKVPILLGNGLGNCTMAVRFAVDDHGVARAEELWNVKISGGGYKIGNLPLYRDGWLILDWGQIIDAQTGKLLFPNPREARGGLAHNGHVLAGGRCYGLSQAGIGSRGASGLADKPQAGVLYCVVTSPLGEKGFATATQCAVESLPATITDPAKRAQVVALTGLDRYRHWYGWHEAYSAPFASGNRLFIRTFDNLYCFGDKTESFSPSAAFNPEK